MSAPSRPQPELAHRIDALVAAFDRIARTRMAGVPVLHAGLRVEAVGFACEAAAPVGPDADPAGPWADGILVTPWFMNLVVFPLRPCDGAADVGRSHTRTIGREPFDFIGAHEPGFGAFAACSLFSPMFEFADHAAAIATAQAVLATLRLPTAEVPVPAPQPQAERPARRQFLFGRPAAASGAST